MKNVEKCFGRPIASEMLANHDSLIRAALQDDLLQQKNGLRYAHRVWVKFDRVRYLQEQAIRAAELADQVRRRLLEGLRLPSGYLDYYLVNPHGVRYSELGNIHFRSPSYDPTFLDLVSLEKRYEQVAEIERIKLHPSLRNKGFLRLLGASLHKMGFHALICNYVYNPALAYNWMQQSQNQNSGIYIISEHTMDDFNRELSPGPSFAIDLERWGSSTT